MKTARAIGAAALISGVALACGAQTGAEKQKPGAAKPAAAGGAIPAKAAAPSAKGAATAKEKEKATTKNPGADRPGPVGDGGADADSNRPVGVGVDDWGQWGGSSIRNNTPRGKNIPTDWNIGGFDLKTGKWQSEKAKNIKWVARLGSQSYGNPVVANGKVYVGTNNGNGYLKRYPAAVDLGVLVCFNAADGKFLWQHSNEKLASGRVNDWMYQGVCCAPLVEGNRLWYVSNRGEVVCLDTEGFYDDKDDGPVTKEWARQCDIPKKDDPAKDQFAPTLAALNKGQVSDALTAEFAKAGIDLPDGIAVKTDEAGKQWSFQAKDGDSLRDYQVRLEAPPKLSGYRMITPDDKNEADVVWRLDMMKELGTFQHNMCSCSVTSAGDLLFVNTSNGVDEGHINMPAPSAPSFLALDKHTGKVVWTDNSPGKNVLHGQWSSPSFAVLGGVPQVLFGGGDGWLYSFRGEATKDGKAELLWKFDCNPKESAYLLKNATRNHIISTPMIYRGLVYVSVGEDPEHLDGFGHSWCIDPTKRGDVSSELAFNVKDLKHPIPHRREQAVIKENGEVARPNPNSAAVWRFDHGQLTGKTQDDFTQMMHRSMSTAAAQDGLVFIPDFNGAFHCLDAATGEQYWAHDMLSACWGSPLIVEGKVYVGDEDGDVVILRFSKEKEVLGKIRCGSSVYSTPIVANNVLFVSNQQYLFAIEAQ